MRRGQLENQRRKCLCDFPRWFPSVWFFLSEVRLWHLSLFRLERYIKTHQWAFSHLTPAQVACDGRSVQHFLASNSSIWLWCWVPRFTQFYCHSHPGVFHACEGLGAAKKAAVCVGIWVRSSLCETGPVVLYRGICPFTETSYQWVLLWATLFVWTEAVWLSWQLFIDAFCLSAFVFYLIDLFSVLNRWDIPKILLSNVLLPGSGMFSVKPLFFSEVLEPTGLPWALTFTAHFLNSFSEDVISYTFWFQ